MENDKEKNEEKPIAATLNIIVYIEEDAACTSHCAFWATMLQQSKFEKMYAHCVEGEGSKFIRKGIRPAAAYRD